MTKQFLLTLALASLTALLVAQSPPPPPTPAKPSQAQQRATEENKQNTSSPNSSAQSGPTSDNQPTAQPTATNIETQSTPKSDDSSIKWGVILGVINAVLLTVFNGVLAWVGWKQYHGMREQIEIAKTSANAAKESADAARNAILHAETTTHLTQRGVVLLEDVVAEPHGGQDGRSHYFLPNSLLVFSLKNYGQTVAYNVMMEGKIRFGDKYMPVHGDPGMTMAPQGSNKWITASLITQLTAKEIETASTGNNLLTYVIDVKYDDVFGKPHTYKVTGSYIAPLQGFITGMSVTSD